VRMQAGQIKVERREEQHAFAENAFS